MTTPRDDIAGLSERLRETLGGIAQEESGGDNLAILLASYFEPAIESEELNDCGTWKQGAIDACDKVLDAIHAHYATQLDALSARVKELETNPTPQDYTKMARMWAEEKARATRLQQERDEAYAFIREVKKDSYLDDYENDFKSTSIAEQADDFLRRIASGPEKS